MLDQPSTEIGIVANQLDRNALVPVQGGDEVNEQQLPDGVRHLIQHNQPHAIDRLRASLLGCAAT
jgi:hypothetical protein